MDLRKHCVETEIRRLYNRSISHYFKDGADRERLEAEIDLLEKALRILDFSRLRKDFADLSGGSEDRIELGRTETGGIVLTKNGERIG